MPQSPITIVAASLVLCAVVAALLRRKVKPAAEAAGRIVLDRVRPYLPAGVRRVARRWHERIDHATVRTVVVAAIAAGIAWFAAETLHLAGAVTASISAILSVHLSSHASVRDGTRRMIGTLAGVGFAVSVWGCSARARCRSPRSPGAGSSSADCCAWATARSPCPRRRWACWSPAAPAPSTWSGNGPGRPGWASWSASSCRRWSAA
ncbi:aromatic acid exporter family protein [Paractinoplanes durhamensis]|uniref:aromatic acid exporter family protein n=1 Tax=Paractinoplanes durhamensis TaxID=113563 RepID=UPI003638CD42